MARRSLLSFFFFLLLLPLSLHAKASSPPPITKLKEKLTHLRFFLHDIVSGRKPTAIPVVKAVSGGQPNSFFGMIMMIDDPLTESPDPNSKQVGRSQGMYAAVAQQEFSLLMAMNLVFMAGKYNGSVLSVLGRNSPFSSVREMPVVGGSGRFRFARGYALARTHWLNLTSKDAIIEYNVHVLHY